MSIIGKLIKWIAITVLALSALVVVTFAAVGILGLTVNLDFLKPGVETAVSVALNRKVQVTGPVVLQASLRPGLEIQGVEIRNPKGYTEPLFAAIDLARVEIGIVALLKKQIDIGEITCEGGILNLESNNEGKNNWQFSTASARENAPTGKLGEKKEKFVNKKHIGLLALDKLSLKKISVTYRDSKLKKTLRFRLDSLTGSAQQGQVLKLQGNGSFQNKKYNFTVDGAALDEFRPLHQLYPLSIAGTLAGSPFTAKGSFGKEENKAKLDLDATLSKVDIGGLLAWLQVAEGIEAETEELALKVSLRGNSLHKVLTLSNFIFSVKDGTLTLHGAGKGDGLPIAMRNAEVGIAPGQPVSLAIEGTIDTTPISIKMQGMELVKYIGNLEQLPISIVVEAAETIVHFDGELQLPVSGNDLNFAMTIQGDQLNSLNELFNVDLPPFGPYSLKSNFVMHDKGYRLSNLGITMGSSDLTGQMSLDMASEKPLATLELISNVLQINDFALGDWSPDGGKAKNPQKGEEETKSEEGASSKELSKEKREKVEEKAAFLLSAETLNRANGHLLIQLKSVRSGKDTLGSGKLEVSLQDGLFSIDPLELQLEGGVALTEFSYYPTADAAEMHLRSTINKLDVGIIAHRVKPDSTMGGYLSLDILLDAKAASLNQLLANGQGHFDVVFAPVNLDAGLLDLWAVNVLAALSSKMDEGASSQMNCAVASFDLTDGLMHERTIFIDTTHMSIEAEANINFKTEELRIKAVPSAKKPEFFSLGIPVKVQGKFEDFGLGINKLRIVTSLVSFITSPVHVPLRRIFVSERPEDGYEACRVAWEYRKRDEVVAPAPELEPELESIKE